MDQLDSIDTHRADMPLPDSRELREILDGATPGPWKMKWGLIVSHDKGADIIADLEGRGDVEPRSEDVKLLLLAPQLAEEVIRLREEIDRIKQYCLDGCRIAEAAEYSSTGEAKSREQGKQAAYYDTYLQITQGQHKEDQ